MARKSISATNANEGGKFLENLVANQLNYFGLNQFVPRSGYNKTPTMDPKVKRDDPMPFDTGEAFYARQVRGFQRPYGQNWTVDFYVHAPLLLPDRLIIEVKYQDTSGSVDEKLYGLYMSLMARPEPSMIVIKGDAFRFKSGRGKDREIVRWLRAQQNERFYFGYMPEVKVHLSNLLEP